MDNSGPRSGADDAPTGNVIQHHITFTSEPSGLVLAAVGEAAVRGYSTACRAGDDADGCAAAAGLSVLRTLRMLGVR